MKVTSTPEFAETVVTVTDIHCTVGEVRDAQRDGGHLTVFANDDAGVTFCVALPSTHDTVANP